MSSEFHPLSPQVDYTTSSSDGRMDDVSLSSRHTSSGAASISSKFSRASRKSMKKSELGTPLTSCDDNDDDDNDNDEESGGDGSEWVGASNINIMPDNTNTSSTTPISKSYISEDDPFYMFRTDLLQKLTSVESELNRYLSIVSTTDTAVNTHAIKETKKQLKRHVKHAESTLSDLETTVRVVEKQRSKFPHINDEEIDERRKFVDEAKDRIAHAKMSMQGSTIKDKFVNDEKALVERRRSSRGGKNKDVPTISSSNDFNGVSNTNGGGYKDIEEGNDNSATDPERAETLLMMQQQDDTLSDLDLAVTRVGYMAETIHEEIDTQNVMLQNLEDDLADAEEQLGVVMGKLAKLLKTKSKCQLGLIVILSLIVLVLFFVVIYT